MFVVKASAGEQALSSQDCTVMSMGLVVKLFVDGRLRMITVILSIGLLLLFSWLPSSVSLRSYISEDMSFLCVDLVHRHGKITQLQYLRFQRKEI
jgi:hypothetical protein